MIYSKIKLLLITVAVFIITSCSQYDYSIHKPKVRFKPSEKALNRLNSETYGRPYVWAAENNKCYDCSGLTYYTFGSMGVEIPRTANEQFHTGTPISRDELQKGDLVFFGRRGRATHVGIYMGNGMFQHASSAKRRVIICSLNTSYYRRHYLGARRYYNFNNYQQFQPKMQTAYAQTTPVERENQSVSLVSISQPLYQNGANSGKYYLRVGAFREYPSALITKLELSGIQVKTKKENGLFKVLAGPFNTASEARQNITYNPTLLSNSAIVQGNG